MADTDVGQYSLPYLPEVEDPIIAGETDPTVQSGLRRPSHETPPLHGSGSQKFRAPKRTRTSERRKPSAKVNLPPHAKLLVSREEAAAMLSISVRGLDYLIATKRLSTRRIGTRVLIPIEDVRKFARADHPQRLAG